MRSEVKAGLVPSRRLRLATVSRQENDTVALGRGGVGADGACGVGGVPHMNSRAWVLVGFEAKNCRI